MNILSTELLAIVAAVIALATLPGTFLLALLSLAGLRSPRRVVALPAKGRLAIVVPAHNEAQGIARTVRNLIAEAHDDKATDVVVIADNCTDNTAQVSRKSGARVIVRNDLRHRGKGFALDFAFRRLLASDYRFFVVIDADSEVAPGFLNAFRRRFAAGAQVLQARYTVLNTDGSMRNRLMQIALCAFNVLRPRGREVLGWSAGILGNGFGLRREILERIPYTAGSVVEDLEYHLVLTWHGVRVEFADDALVRGEMPSSGSGVRTQRARWEGGRLRMLVEHAPGLARDVCFGRHGALEPLLDLMLLPLSHHVALLCLLLAIPLPWAQGLAGLSLLVLAGHVLAAAKVSGLPARTLSALLYVPFYVVWKLLLIPMTLMQARGKAPWLRTAREIARQGAHS